jgi:cell division protein FtsB
MNIWSLIIRLSWAALAIIVVIALVRTFYPQVQRANEMQRQVEQAEEEVRLEKEMLQHLKAKQERLLSDPRFVERIAREELGLAKPGETVFKFLDDAPTNTRARRP